MLAALASTPATLGAGRLVCVDGFAGSGKTTLATAIQRATGARVLHTDEMLHGWRGLFGLGDTLDRLLRPLASDDVSAWTRWDWHADDWAETFPVPPLDPGELLLVEGVGSSVGPHRDLISLALWVDANEATRTQRWLDRDGSEARPFIEQWQSDERSLHRAAETRARAHLILTT